MAEMGKEGASDDASCDDPGVCLLAFLPEQIRGIPGADNDGCHHQEECYLLQIQHHVEIENLPGTLAEYHAQYKSVDMEMIDGIYLRVEIVDDAEQHHAGYLHDSCRLVPSETYEDEAEEIRYQRKHGCMADAGGYEEQPSL